MVDNAEDATMIDTDVKCKKFGEAYAKGILTTLGITDVPVTDDTIYRVQVGAFKDRKNAESLQAELKSKGYDGIIVEGK